MENLEPSQILSVEPEEFPCRSSDARKNLDRFRNNLDCSSGLQNCPFSEKCQLKKRHCDVAFSGLDVGCCQLRVKLVR